MSGIIMSTISLLTHLYTNPVKSWQQDSLSAYQVGKPATFLLYSSTLYFRGANRAGADDVIQTILMFFS